MYRFPRSLPYAPFLLPGLAALALLGGCGTPEGRALQAAETLPEADRAYIIGTQAVECVPRRGKCLQGFNVMSINYRSTDGKGVDARLRFQVPNGFGGETVPDYEHPERHEKGAYFCLALPPGRYQIYGYEFLNPGGSNNYSLRKEHEFDIPFTLAPGEVVHLGKLKLTNDVGENLFGMKLSAPGKLLLSSAPSADIAAALKKCPESVRGRKVRDAALKAPAGAGALVQAEPRS